MKLMANLIYKKSIGKNCEKFEEYLEQLSSEQKIEELLQKFNKNLEILKDFISKRIITLNQNKKQINKEKY